MSWMKSSKHYSEKIIRQNYLNGHKVDCMKGKVAFDFEWDSKDQTFDRDLYAFRALSECGIIDVAILLMRSADLNDIFAALGVKSKYGASMTGMGKLICRINAGEGWWLPRTGVWYDTKISHRLETIMNKPWNTEQDLLEKIGDKKFEPISCPSSMAI